MGSKKISTRNGVPGIAIPKMPSSAQVGKANGAASAQGHVKNSVQYTAPRPEFPAKK